MQVKSITLKDCVLENNVFLAPMAGFTDSSFRGAVSSFPYGLKFTELVSAKGLYFGGNGSVDLLECNGDYDKTAVQLFGADPYYLRWACESEYLKDFKIVDINMGCPVPKVYKNGEGSALLNDILLAEKIIKECVKSNKIITVKIRTGLVKGDDIASDYAKMAENSGASLVTIHGRVREDYYSGEPDYSAIREAKNSVKIPIIANGGIFNKEKADEMMEKTNADGIMLARGAFIDPFLVCKLQDKKPPLTLKQFIIKHLENMIKTRGEYKSAMEFRKFIPYYFKGITGIKELKTAICNENDARKIIELIDKYL